MITTTNKVSNIREIFRDLKVSEQYVLDKTGCKMLEIIGATFLADEDTIFGKVNQDYVQREIQWYESQSRYVKDIPGGAPKEWIRCADADGKINSNYGWVIWSEENHLQYKNVINELKNSHDSRRAVMIYTRPTMWLDYNKNGMKDFMCTNVVQYFIRDNKLHALVQMRSNDAWAGYRNDRAFQDHVQKMLANEIGIEVGNLIWHAGSIHLYERNFYLVDGFIRTGKFDLTKQECDLLEK